MPIKYTYIPKLSAVVKKLRRKQLKNKFIATKLKRTKQQVSDALRTGRQPGLLIAIDKLADRYEDKR